jgi:hypothetical protein
MGSETSGGDRDDGPEEELRALKMLMRGFSCIDNREKRVVMRQISGFMSRLVSNHVSSKRGIPEHPASCLTS